MPGAQLQWQLPVLAAWWSFVCCLRGGRHWWASHLLIKVGAGHGGKPLANALECGSRKADPVFLAGGSSVSEVGVGCESCVWRMAGAGQWGHRRRLGFVRMARAGLVSRLRLQPQAELNFPCTLLSPTGRGTRAPERHGLHVTERQRGVRLLPIERACHALNR